MVLEYSQPVCVVSSCPPAVERSVAPQQEVLHGVGSSGDDARVRCGLAARAHAYGVYDHIREQEAFFERLGCNKTKQHVPGAMSAPARTRQDGPAARPSCRTAGTPGLLADIGAVRPLSGLALVESQVE